MLRVAAKKHSKKLYFVSNASDGSQLEHDFLVLVRSIPKQILFYLFTSRVVFIITAVLIEGLINLKAYNI